MEEENTRGKIFIEENIDLDTCKWVAIKYMDEKIENESRFEETMNRCNVLFLFDEERNSKDQMSLKVVGKPAEIPDIKNALEFASGYISNVGATKFEISKPVYEQWINSCDKFLFDSIKNLGVDSIIDVPFNYWKKWLSFTNEPDSRIILIAYKTPPGSKLEEKTKKIKDTVNAYLKKLATKKVDKAKPFWSEWFCSGNSKGKTKPTKTIEITQENRILIDSLLNAGVDKRFLDEVRETVSKTLFRPLVIKLLLKGESANMKFRSNNAAKDPQLNVEADEKSLNRMISMLSSVESNLKIVKGTANIYNSYAFSSDEKFLHKLKLLINKQIIPKTYKRAPWAAYCLCLTPFNNKIGFPFLKAEYCTVQSPDIMKIFKAEMIGDESLQHAIDKMAFERLDRELALTGEKVLKECYPHNYYRIGEELVIFGSNLRVEKIKRHICFNHGQREVEKTLQLSVFQQEVAKKICEQGHFNIHFLEDRHPIFKGSFTELENFSKTLMKSCKFISDPNNRSEPDISKPVIGKCFASRSKEISQALKNHRAFKINGVIEQVLKYQGPALRLKNSSTYVVAQPCDPLKLPCDILINPFVSHHLFSEKDSPFGLWSMAKVEAHLVLKKELLNMFHQCGKRIDNFLTDCFNELPCSKILSIDALWFSPVNELIEARLKGFFTKIFQDLYEKLPDENFLRVIFPLDSLKNTNIDWFTLTTYLLKGLENFIHDPGFDRKRRSYFIKCLVLVTQDQELFKPVARIFQNFDEKIPVQKENVTYEWFWNDGRKFVAYDQETNNLINKKVNKKKYFFKVFFQPEKIPGTHTVDLDFLTITDKTLKQISTIQRNVNASGGASWVYSKENKKIHKKASDYIEFNYNKKVKTFDLFLKFYNIDINKMVQINAETKFEREIRREEKKDVFERLDLSTGYTQINLRKSLDYEPITICFHDERSKEGFDKDFQSLCFEDRKKEVAQNYNSLPPGGEKDLKPLHPIRDARYWGETAIQVRKTLPGVAIKRIYEILNPQKMERILKDGEARPSDSWFISRNKDPMDIFRQQEYGDRMGMAGFKQIEGFRSASEAFDLASRESKSRESHFLLLKLPNNEKSNEGKIRASERDAAKFTPRDPVDLVSDEAAQKMEYYRRRMEEEEGSPESRNSPDAKFLYIEISE